MEQLRVNFLMEAMDVFKDCCSTEMQLLIDRRHRSLRQVTARYERVFEHVFRKLDRSPSRAEFVRSISIKEHATAYLVLVLRNYSDEDGMDDIDLQAVLCQLRVLRCLAGFPVSVICPY